MKNALSQFQTEYQELKAWREVNPELNEAWNQAWEEDKQRDDARSLLRHRHVALHLLSRAGADELPIEAAVEPRETQHIELARRFLAADHSKRWWLVMLGSKGQGKTTAAAWAAAEILARRHCASRPSGETVPQVMWLSSVDLGSTSLFGTEAERWKENLKSTPLLVIDDFGRELSHDATKALMFEVINRRTSNRRTTIMTSNLIGEEFGERLGPELRDRVKACCLAFEGDGPSLRAVPR